MKGSASAGGHAPSAVHKQALAALERLNDCASLPPYLLPLATVSEQTGQGSSVLTSTPAGCVACTTGCKPM